MVISFAFHLSNEMDKAPVIMRQKIILLSMFGLLPHRIPCPSSYRYHIISRFSLFLVAILFVSYTLFHIKFDIIYKSSPHNSIIWQCFGLLGFGVICLIGALTYGLLISKQKPYFDQISTLISSSSRFNLPPCRNSHRSHFFLAILYALLFVLKFSDTFIRDSALTKSILKLGRSSQAELNLKNVIFSIFYASQFALPILVMIWITLFTDQFACTMTRIKLKLSTDYNDVIPEIFFDHIRELLDNAGLVMSDTFGYVVLLSVAHVVLSAVMYIYFIFLSPSPFVVVITIMNIFIIYVWCEEGYYINRQADDLRDKLTHHLFTRRIMNKHLEEKMKLLVNRMHLVPLCLTSVGFFNINRTFFLSIIGILGSYGVVMATLDQ
ncbi:Uncharacterised protein r2_g373 [Pycnogonum litorale]